MMKKILALAAAASIALTLSACGGPVEQLPALTKPGDGVSSTASSASGTPESSAASGAETSSEAPQQVLASGFEDNLDGLCEYLEKNYAVAGEKTEMSYKEIGAIGGYRYKFTYNGSTVQAEFYEFDLDNWTRRARRAWTASRRTASSPCWTTRCPPS